MATGGEEFGDERTPLLRKTDDQDDGDAGPGGNETTGFEPGSSSTPAPNGNQRQTTLNRPGEQPSFDELPDTPDVLATTTFAAENELLKEFPFAKISMLKYKMDDKGRVEVGLTVKGKPYNRLLTEIKRGEGEYQINKSLPKEVKRLLGKPRREIIKEKMEMLAESINESKKIIDDPFENQTEKNKARKRLKRQTGEQTDLERELGKLIKRDYQPSESIELETFQTNDGVRQEREKEIQRKIEEQTEIANDKNRPSAERESAKENVEELKQEKMKSRMNEKEKSNSFR